MKRIVLLITALSLAACAQPPAEAKCKCFGADGKSTGNCDFVQLPDEPAIYKLLPGKGEIEQGLGGKVLCGVTKP